MRLLETARSLVRRWYILLFGLIATAGLCWTIQQELPATYEAQGSLVLMPPPLVVGENGNPYLYLGGMSQAMDVLIRHLTVAEEVRPILEQFPETNFTIEADRTTTGPIILVSAAGSTSETTLEVLETVMSKVPVSLKNMQDELALPENQRISVRTVVADRQAIRNDQNQSRFLLIAGTGGIVGTILLASTLDGVLLARNETRGRRAEPTRERRRLLPTQTSNSLGDKSSELRRANQTFDRSLRK